jgi:hypothetical protein
MTIKHLYPNSRPTLDLKFAKDKTLDPRITFTRASSGTYVDENGVIQSAASGAARFDHDPETNESLGLLVEESRTNLTLYSEDFTNAAWQHGAETLHSANQAVAPDGTITADLLYPKSTGFVRSISQNYGNASGTYTVSVFAKAGGRNFIYVYNAQGNAKAWFNLSTGAKGSADAGITDYGIIDYGNGWYRCWVSTNSTTSRFFFLGPADGDNSTEVTASGTNGIYVWGAQFEAGSFPTSYIPTPATFTSRASTATYYDASGVIQTAAIDVARDDAYFPDENGVMQPAGLLLEAAATNLSKQSENFTSGWISSPPFVTATADQGLAPDGNLTADIITETEILTTHYANRSDVSVTSGVTYTFSVYLKKGPGATAPDWIILTFNSAGMGGGGAAFNLSTGEIGNKTSSIISANIELLPNGWRRCFIAKEATSTSSGSSGAIIFTNNQNTASIPIYLGSTTSDVYAWGAQLEAGSYPTSYIPTTSSTVTRAADVSSSSTVTRAADVAQITGSNFSSWYNQSEGTWTASLPLTSKQAGSRVFTCGTEIWVTPPSQITAVRPGSSTNYISVTHPVIAAAAYNASTCVGVAGGLVSSNVGGTLTAPTQLIIGRSTAAGVGYINVPISRLTYYPTRLSNAILQNLTT